MPSYWGDGQSTDKETLDGNATTLSCKPFGITCLMDKEPRRPRALEIREPTLRSRTGPAFIVVAVAWPVTRGFPSGFRKGFIMLSMRRPEPFRLFGKGSSSAWGGEAKERAISIPGADPFSLPKTSLFSP